MFTLSYNGAGILYDSMESQVLMFRFPLLLVGRSDSMSNYVLPHMEAAIPTCVQAVADVRYCDVCSVPTLVLTYFLPLFHSYNPCTLWIHLSCSWCEVCSVGPTIDVLHGHIHPRNPLAVVITNIGQDVCGVPCCLPADGDENRPPHSELVG